MTAVGTPTAATVAPNAKTAGYTWSALSGVLFAALLTASVFMSTGLPAAKDATKVQQWAVKHTGLLAVASVVVTLAVIVGLYFLIWLHGQLTKGRPDPVGYLFLVGAAVFGLSGTVGAGLHISLSQDAKHLSVTSLQLLASLEQNLNYSMTCAGLALMYLAAGILIRRTTVLPGWLAWPSWVFALLAATLVAGFVPLIGSALWMIVVGVYLAVRPPAEG